MNSIFNKAGRKASIFLALIMTALGGNSAFADISMTGWIVKGNGGGIVEGKNYSLFNTDQKEYLRYQDRSGGNLGWSKNANNFMRVQRQTPSNQPIKCEEKFGLFIEKEWPMYETQTYGINLSTRTKLANSEWYQWKFQNCGSAGSPVNLNQPVSLVNTAANMTVVGCERLVGVNLCWTEDVVTFRGKNYRKADVKTLVGAGKVAVEILKLL